jgi:hypothetical protein
MMYETDTPVTSATSDDLFLDSKDINDLDFLQKKSRRGRTIQKNIKSGYCRDRDWYVWRCNWRCCLN